MRPFLLSAMIVAAFIVSPGLRAQPLPKTEIAELRSGKKVAFSQTVKKGRITVISFWATWCIPGKREVKKILRELPSWRKQVDFDYITVAVDQPHNEDVARQYATAQGWDFPAYVDAQSALKRCFDFNALPFTMIVDQEGNMVFSHVGNEDVSILLRKMKQLGSKKERR